MSNREPFYAPFAEGRLPDLPNAGYASHGARMASDIMMTFLRRLERGREGRMLHLYIVCMGRQRFRQWGMKNLRLKQFDHDVWDAMWYYLAQTAGPAPEEQLKILAQLPG